VFVREQAQTIDIMVLKKGVGSLEVSCTEDRTKGYGLTCSFSSASSSLKFVQSRTCTHHIRNSVQIHEATSDALSPQVFTSIRIPERVGYVRGS
jgi:hypothetical protein